RRYHLAGTFDPQTGEITYFVNGRLNTTHRLSGRFKPSSYPMTLAASPTSGNKAHYHWQGCLEQVRISNTIRYRDNFEPDDELRADDHALLVLPLNEGSGPTVFDASGHNHHGIIIGA